ncbi:MAG: hypothetical protein U0Q11_07685 [Vicinamibacterales bacterium]
MRLLAALGVLAALTATCSGTSQSPTSPSAAATISGTWLGAAADSTGSMMGAGMSASMMGNTTWNVTQAGSAFSGTMQFPGYQGGTIVVSGAMNGRTGTFTMTMPSGSMMSGGCTATATGTFEMDDMMKQFHGSYTGTNSCSGPFSNGSVSMHR